MSRERNSAQKGQGVVEYILITALTALATVAIFRVFRADVSQAYRQAGEALIRGVQEGVSSDNSADSQSQ